MHTARSGDERLWDASLCEGVARRVDSWDLARDVVDSWDPARDVVDSWDLARDVDSLDPATVDAFEMVVSEQKSGAA